MRCVIIDRFGEPAEVLHAAERPLPEPGPGQVRVKLIQSPIHNHDLAIIRGVYGYRPPLPAIPGTEALGTVDALGPGVDAGLAGQRVCVAGAQGTWAEAFLAKAAGVVPVPAAISDDVACQLLAMPMSAAMLLEDLALPAGSWIVQNAAGGAVGRMIESVARDRGLHVVNLVRRQEGVAALQAAGIERVLSTDDPQWTEKVPALTGGAPIARAVDSVGGRAANDLLQVLGTGGVLISFGALSGEPLVLDPRGLVFKETTVRGYWATQRAERTSAADYRRMVGDLLRLAVEQKLPLAVEARFELARAAEAAVAATRPGRTGKVALRA
jgi:NADPH:quinone reductase